MLFGRLRIIVATGVAVALLIHSPYPSRAQGTPDANAPRVAVFGEAGFPSWFTDEKGVPPPPDAIVARLESLGIAAEVVHADALTDSSRFNAGRYSLLVMPYGNCYPQVAGQNLQTFHREGGGFVLTGIPFTHPAALDRGAAEGWSANPGWGDSVRAVPGAGQRGENALLIHSRPDDWSGGASVRFPVHPGENMRLSAQFRDQGGKPSNAGHLFLRFWDASGNFIGQLGPDIPDAEDWQTFSEKITTPDKAASADVSPQIWNEPHREVLMTGLVVEGDGKIIPVPNANFARAGDRWRDLGDGSKEVALFGPKGVGVGSFAGQEGGATYVAAPDDPLQIAGLGYIWKLTSLTQWLDPNSLPETDTIIPLVGTRVRPVAALVVHHSDDYRGVVDAWMYMGPGGESDTAGMGQMIVRGVVAALRQQKRLTEARADACYAALNRLAGAKVGKTAVKGEGKASR